LKKKQKNSQFDKQIKQKIQLSLQFFGQQNFDIKKMEKNKLIIRKINTSAEAASIN
jgi:hypothetical protein